MGGGEMMVSKMERNFQEQAIEEMEQVFKDSFMQPVVTDLQSWHLFDDDEGGKAFPGEYFSKNQAKDQATGKVYSFETIQGYGARLSAPGYMDCTEWTVFLTVQEAVQYLINTYGEE